VSLLSFDNQTERGIKNAVCAADGTLRIAAHIKASVRVTEPMACAS